MKVQIVNNEFQSPNCFSIIYWNTQTRHPAPLPLRWPSWWFSWPCCAWPGSCPWWWPSVAVPVAARRSPGNGSGRPLPRRSRAGGWGGRGWRGGQGRSVCTSPTGPVPCHHSTCHRCETENSLIPGIFIFCKILINN